MAKLAGDHVQVLTGGYELTGDSNRVAISEERDVYDVTAFRDAVHHFVGGPRQLGIAHSGYFNADPGDSHSVLSGESLEGVVSVLLGQNADPAVGDPAFSLPVRQGRYSSRSDMGSFVPFGARFSNKGVPGGWGVALTTPVNISSTTTGQAVDGGAATADGGAAFLHLLTAAASDTYTITVEGADDQGFTQNVATLATFSLDASALGSEQQSISGAIPRYTRYKATRSGSAGDTIRLAINIVRF